MASTRTIFIVLPAYNEQETLPLLLEGIDEAMQDSGLTYRCVVVDDGSSDDTARLIRESASRYPVTGVYHDRNQGLGAALRSGLRQAITLAEGRDIIVTMDADNTHSPGLILRMVRLLQEGYQVVIASRFRPGARVVGVPFYRRLLSSAAALFFKTLFPIPGVRDYTCGFRAYRAEIIQSAFDRYGQEFIDQEGFQCMVDILLKLRLMDVIITETPLLLRYDMKIGESKMKVARTVRKSLELAFRRRFRT